MGTWTFCQQAVHPIALSHMDLKTGDSAARDLGHETIHQADRVLFAEGLTTEERLILLAEELGIPATIEIKEGLNEMCNLGEYIAADNYERGKKENCDDIIRTMRAEGESEEKIVKYTRQTVEYVRSVPDEPDDKD